MSYFMSQYRPVNPGTPSSFTSPIPGWQMNPMAAGPDCVAMSGFGAAGVGYRQTSWGVLYAAVAAALLMGAASGYVAGQRKR